MRRREDTVMQKLVEASVNQILGPPLDPSESSTLGKKRAREEDVMDVSSLFDVKGRVVVVTEGGSGAYLFILFHLPVHHAFLFELLVLCLSSSSMSRLSLPCSFSGASVGMGTNLRRHTLWPFPPVFCFAGPG